MKMKYQCYYCKFRNNKLDIIIDHSTSQHENVPLRYRELVLDDQSGKMRHLTKHHNGIIPFELKQSGREIVVLEDQTYILDTKNKKKKLNTPVKVKDSRRKLELNDENNNNNEENERNENKFGFGTDELLHILPDVLRYLKSAGQMETYLKFNYLLAEKKFPLDNIYYFLTSCSNTSQMRYNEHTLKFWK